jgi:hypothetical protein
MAGERPRWKVLPPIREGERFEHLHTLPVRCMALMIDGVCSGWWEGVEVKGDEDEYDRWAMHVSGSS